MSSRKIIKLQKLLVLSSLSENKKQDFIQSVQYLSNDQLDVFFKCLEEFPELIPRVYANLVRKRTILQNRDTDLWKELLQDEYDELSKYAE